MEIKFSCQELETQIKRDMPDKDAKTRADKTEEISKQQNCKYLRHIQQKIKFCGAKMRAVLSDHPIALVTFQFGESQRAS